jgi:hypothetical protein
MPATRNIIRSATILLQIVAAICLTSCLSDQNAAGKLVVHVINSDGVGLHDATVTTSPSMLMGATNYSGYYTFEDASAGAYTVSASKSGYEKNSVRATVSSGHTTRASIVLPSTGRLAGRVTAMAPSGVVGATVTTNPSTQTVTTGPDGNYTILSVPPGAYTVFASKSGYPIDSTSATVSSGRTTTADIIFSVGSIWGLVTTAGGNYIFGATVTTNPSTKTATTGYDGHFTIRDILPGSYTVSASRSGYISNSTRVTVVARQRTGAGNIGLSGQP